MPPESPVSCMSKPRVVHLTTVHPPFDPRIFWKEAVSLGKAGYEVCVVARHTQAEMVAGVRILPLTPRPGRYRRMLLQREAFRKAQSLNAAVYHFHDPELIPLAYALKRTTGARVIYDMHEDYRWHGPVEGRLIRAMERWCFRWVDHVIVVDPLLLSFVSRYEVPVALIANYHKPLPPASPTPKKRERATGKPFRLIYTGYMGTQRGLFTLLNLANTIVKEQLGWGLDLIGQCRDVQDRQKANAQMQEQGLDAVINRVGWDAFVPAAEMVPYYEQAHVGLVLWQPHPNHSRIPTKFYEYLHHGLPILCSDFPLWCRFVEEHGCGAVVDPSDLAAILGVLKTWETDQELYDVLSNAAADAARAYQWADMEQRLLKVYADLVDA